MKVKEIEFGVTVNLGNYDSSKLSIRVELEEWEDYHQTLTQLKERVISSSGASQSEQAHLLRRIARSDDNQELKHKAKELRETEKLLRSKEEELKELIYQLDQVEDQVSAVSALLKSIRQFEDCSLTEVQKLIKIYEQFKTLQNSSEDSDEYEGYSEF